MQARIWNETKGTYDPYELPEGSSKYENDMDVIVSCACCGKKITYGDAIHHTKFMIISVLVMQYAETVILIKECNKWLKILIGLVSVTLGLLALAVTIRFFVEIWRGK